MPVATTQETQEPVAANRGENANGIEKYCGRSVRQNHLFTWHYLKIGDDEMDSRGSAVKAELKRDCFGHQIRHWLFLATVSIGFPALLAAHVLSPTSAKGQAPIIRNEEQTGARLDIPVDLKKVLSGKLPDPQLQSRDVLLVPNSTGRSALYRWLEEAVSVGTGLAVYRW